MAKPAPDRSAVTATRSVGWVGLGVIGLPMAARLASAGYSVWGYDADTTRRRMAQQAGIRAASDAADCAAHADRLVFCCVRTAEQVDDVLFGATGALSTHPDRGALIMSSLGARAVEAFAAKAEQIGTVLLDAPIHGNRGSAEAGELTMLVSGPAELAFEAEDMLRTFSREVFNIGERPGAAQVVKMVSQHQQITGMIATLEGVALARGYDIDDRVVRDILDATSPSWTTDNWDYARDLWERRDPASSLTIFSKDLAAAIADGAQVNCELPLAAEALRLLRSRCDPKGRYPT